MILRNEKQNLSESDRKNIAIFLLSLLSMGGGGVISDSIDLRSDFRYFVDLREIGKPLSRKTKWGLGAKPPAPPGGREATQDALAGSRGEAPGKFWSF